MVVTATLAAGAAEEDPELARLFSPMLRFPPKEKMEEELLKSQFVCNFTPQYAKIISEIVVPIFENIQVQDTWGGVWTQKEL